MTNHRGRTNCEIDKNLSGMKWTRIYSPFYSSDQFQAAIILWWGYISLRRSNNGKVSPSLPRAAQVTLQVCWHIIRSSNNEFAKCLTFFAKCRAKGCQCELSQIIIATATKTTPQFFLSTHPDQTRFKTHFTQLVESCLNNTSRTPFLITIIGYIVSRTNTFYTGKRSNELAYDGDQIRLRRWSNSPT